MTRLSQYVAFAGTSSVLNLFVRAHHLSTETKEAVLGVDREKPDTQQPGNLPIQDPVELIGVREDGPGS